MNKTINLTNDNIAWDIKYADGKFNLIVSIDGRNFIVNKFNSRLEAISNFDKIINNFINGKNEIPCRGVGGM